MRTRRIRTIAAAVGAAVIAATLVVISPPAPAAAQAAAPPVGGRPDGVPCAPSIVALLSRDQGGECNDPASLAGFGPGPGGPLADNSSVSAATNPGDRDIVGTGAARTGSLAGTVTDELTGAPLDGAMVVAVPATGGPPRGAIADAAGRYRLSMPLGTYRVQFVDPSGRHRAEWFEDRTVDDFAAATPVAISSAGPRTVDAALAPAGASGAIAGSVSASGTGQPISGAWVVAVRATDGRIAGGTLSAADGSYRVVGLEADAYRLAVVDPTMAHAYELFFRDKASFQTGDDIAVSAGATAPVNVDLATRSAPTTSATIVGTVTDSVSGGPVGGVWVAAVNANTGVFTAATVADGNGDYTIGVPAGPYKIEMLDSTATHAPEWHHDVTLGEFGSALPVSVAPGATVRVDEDLAPLTGSIAGTVTEVGSTAPIAGAWVIALRPADAAPVGLGVADAFGRYEIGGLGLGAYRVAVVDPSGVHKTELFYRDRATLAAGDDVVVTGGTRTTMDVDLDVPPPPTVSSFTASVSDTNRITLNWATDGGDSTNELYIFDDTTPTNPATGFLPQDGSTSFRVGAAGVRRFRLSIANDAGGRVVVPASVTVPFLAPPVITSANPTLVDEIVKRDVTITWRHPTGGFARVTRPNGSKVDVAGTPSGATVDGSLLVTAASLKPGRNTFAIAFCKTTPDASTPLCTETANANVMVGPQQFTGDYRQYVTPGQTVTLNWTGSGSGRFFNLASSRLGLNSWSTGSSLDVTVPANATGVYDIALTTCAFLAGGSSTCANQDRVTTPSAGSVSWVAPVGTVLFAGWEVARVTTPTGEISLKAPRTGSVSQVLAPVGTAVAAGASVVMLVDPSDVGSLQLVVSSRRWVSRDVLTDFESAAGGRVPIWTDPAIGSPLDVMFAPSGDLWTTGEFGSAMSRWNGTGVDAYDVPLLHKPDINGRYVPVNPFSLFGPSSNSRRSALVERVIWADDKVWFTQGGALFGPATGNHSRVLSFDPAATDLPHTENDERYCAVNVPNDGAEVVGLAYDGQRIWYAEGSFTRTPSVNSFDPDELPCDNLLDFSDPEALAGAVHQYCTEPDDHGCIRHIEIPGGSGVSNLEFDAEDGAIWATEFYAGAITRVDVSTAAVQRFPIPPSSRPGTFFGGAPWQLRIDEDYVYYLDYSDVDLVRFHKDTHEFEELHLPMSGIDLGGHSIELVGTKLWFTEGGRDSDGAAVGYVDTADWGPGVIYHGLSNLVDTSRAAVGPASPAGIAVRSDGTLAVADYFRRQVLLLRPL